MAILRCSIINIPGAGISNIIIDIMLMNRIEYFNRLSQMVTKILTLHQTHLHN